MQTGRVSRREVVGGLCLVGAALATATAVGAGRTGPSGAGGRDAVLGDSAVAGQGAAGSGGVTLVAAGDLACAADERKGVRRCAHDRTARLAEQLDPAAVLLLGDIQYPAGSPEDFAEEGGYTGTWSRLLDRTFPVPGNHEWRGSGAAGYRQIFHQRTGGLPYYSREVGDWHLVALDSSCDDVGGCDVDSPQVRWLRADLAAADGRPTIVMWHHPRHSSGEHGNERDVDDLWEVSVGDPDVQVVLNGHDHDYERWHRMDAEGEPTTAGARQFVVGTGGRSHYCSDGERDSRSAVFDCSSFGVLALTLRSDGYDWRFHAATGSFTDAGRSGLRPRPASF
jgi:hypothetical protein